MTIFLSAFTECDNPFSNESTGTTPQMHVQCLCVCILPISPTLNITHLKYLSQGWAEQVTQKSANRDGKRERRKEAGKKKSKSDIYRYEDNDGTQQRMWTVRLVDKVCICVCVCLCVQCQWGYIPALKPVCLQIRLVHHQYPPCTVSSDQTPANMSTYSSILILAFLLFSYRQVNCHNFEFMSWDAEVCRDCL